MGKVVLRYVWELPVRITHWVNVLAIITLCVTGLFAPLQEGPGVRFELEPPHFLHEGDDLQQELLRPDDLNLCHPDDHGYVPVLSW